MLGEVERDAPVARTERTGADPDERAGREKRVELAILITQ